MPRLRNHTFAELRRRQKGEDGHEPVLASDDEPVLPVDDQRTLDEEQMRVEKLLDAAEQVAESHREQVALLTEADGRTKEGADAAPKDAAARKRKERARNAVAAAVGALVAAAVMLLVLRRAPTPVGLPPGAFATLADATHALANERCAAREWVGCLEQLQTLRKLDDSRFGPAEQAAWTAAVAGMRQDAFVHCQKDGAELVTCLEELDAARRYDPEGDKDPTVTLARAEATRRLRGPEIVPEDRNIIPPGDNAKPRPF